MHLSFAVGKWDWEKLICWSVVRRFVVHFVAFVALLQNQILIIETATAPPPQDVRVERTTQNCATFHPSWENSEFYDLRRSRSCKSRTRTRPSLFYTTTWSVDHRGAPHTARRHQINQSQSNIPAMSVGGLGARGDSFQRSTRSSGLATAFHC